MLRRSFVLQLVLFTAVAWALVPADLSEDDPLIDALHHRESWVGGTSFVPNTMQDAREKVSALISQKPDDASLYKALADIEVQMLDFASAETNMREYVRLSPNKDEAYEELQSYYHSRLEFEKELRAMEEHASILQPLPGDVEANSGRYRLYERIRQHISETGLENDPATYYALSIESYPGEKQPYLDFVEYLKARDKKRAREILRQFSGNFPGETETILRLEASLLTAQEAFEMLDRNFDPLWNSALIQLFESTLAASGKKSEYLNRVRTELGKNPQNVNAAARLFYAYQVSGNLLEAQNTLNDLRLVKDKAAATGVGSWSADELFLVARLNQMLLNFNEAARYYFALYAKLAGTQPGHATLKTDDALFGLFEILLQAEDRPVQIGAGNLDYYKDIATMDQGPGILNGILSLILNGTDAGGEMQQQEQDALGYFNRATAHRLLFHVQRKFPDSTHLPRMYASSLKIYGKYGMNDLIVEAGEQFLDRYPDAPEIFQVGQSVADAYSRLNNSEKEWQTYERMLQLASKKDRLFAPNRPRDADEELGAYETQQQRTTYEDILYRYIASLTYRKNYTAVLKLFRDQLQRHPDEQILYERFADYLGQNQLFREEEELYKNAIARFQSKSWYDKLARWYLRQRRDRDFERLSEEMMTLFAGTEIQQYLQNLGGQPSEQMFLRLNLYARKRFPLNLQFVKNLLGYYKSKRMFEEWKQLAFEYYFLDSEIRNSYLALLAKERQLPEVVDSPANDAERRFAGDVQIWRSHFEEGLDHIQQLAEKHSSDPALNLLAADLQRSLGVSNPAGYERSAKIRERLARIQPSDASLWTTAGETLADIEMYPQAELYWNQILQIEPRNPERYLEVATIYWDYYLFDSALDILSKAREMTGNRSLYAYEAGAILESKRDYRAAIAEYSSSVVNGSNDAAARLSTLYGRPKYKELIQKHLEDRLKENMQSGEWWIGIIRFYSSEKEDQLVRSLLNRMQSELQASVFSGSASEAREIAHASGFLDIEESLLRLAISRSADETQRITRTLELARFYEANRQQAQAETTYANLYQSFPRSAGVIDELLSYYWRNNKYEEAFSLYQTILGIANSRYKKKYQIQLANKYKERKLYDQALEVAGGLLNEEPLNTSYFELIAGLYAEQKAYTKLAEHYKNGLQRVSESSLPADEKQRLTASFRKGIIAAQVILGDATAALDQYIEILNRDAESESMFNETAQFASRHQLLDRLQTYYENTASASPKDHRWPALLGRIYLFRSRFADAVTAYEKAIQIRPERLDFHQQFAETYRRIGDYKSAIEAYQKLYELSYRDKAWLAPIAELYARTANPRRAIETYQETIDSMPKVEQDFLLCEKTRTWGMLEDAVEFGASGMKRYFSDMSIDFPSQGYQSYLEALLRTHRTLQAFDVIEETRSRIDTNLRRATFDTETLSSAQYAARSVHLENFPALLAQYGTQEDLETVQTAILSAIAKKGGYGKSATLIQEFYLPMASAAHMAPAEETLLRNLAEHYIAAQQQQPNETLHRRLRGQLRDFYNRRNDFSKCGEWLENIWMRSPNRGIYPEDLVEAAQAYGLANQTQKELGVLRKYYAVGIAGRSLQPVFVERYLEILYELNAQQELREAAAKANLTAANYFVKRRDKALAMLAIQALSKTLHQPAKPVWQTIQLAMLGLELQDASDFFEKEFQTALNIQPVESLLQLQMSDPQDKWLTGDNWFFYASKYGAYHRVAGKADSGRFYLPADLEGSPTSDSRQNQLARYYLAEKEYALAVEHSRLATELRPDNLYHRDLTAHALALDGRKEEAIEVWLKLAMDYPENPAAQLLLLKASVEHKFTDSIRSHIEQFLLAQIRRSGATQASALIQLYMDTLSPSENALIWKVWLPSAPSPVEFGEHLLSNGNLTDPLKNRIFEGILAYVDTQRKSAAGSLRVNFTDQWVLWSIRYAEHLAQKNDYENAGEIVDRAQREYRQLTANESYSARRATLLLIDARLKLKRGDLETAIALLQTWAEEQQEDQTQINVERYRRIARLLREEGFANEASDFLERMYLELLARGATERANYVGLAEVYLQLNRMEQAKDVLRRMIFLQAEDASTIEDAASLLEKNNRTEDAIEYREDLRKRIPWDDHNTTMLSANLLAAGRKRRAASLSAEVLRRSLAAGEDLKRAAEVHATSAGSTIGLPEMRAIQVLLRSGKSTIPPTTSYARWLRATALEKRPGDIDLLLASFQMHPDDHQTRLSLFEAYWKQYQCRQALFTLDPDEKRRGGYYARRNTWRSFRNWPDEYSESEESGSYYPIEELNLGHEQTRQLAIQAADCAQKLEDSQTERFFIEMAMQHCENQQCRETLATRLAALQQKIQDDQNLERNRFKITRNLGRNAE